MDSVSTSPLQPSRRLALYAKLVVAMVLFVILRGAMVTTAGVGMAVPDWPLSFGSINPPGWWRDFGVYLEHSHRLFAQLLGWLSLGLFAWVWRDRGARHLRTHAGFFLAGVIIQAVLGGLRVTENNSHPEAALAFRIIHGCIAQATLCLVVALAARLSPRWQNWSAAASSTARNLPRRLAWVTAAAVYIQLIFGASMRHLGAGLAIPTFPAANPAGGLLPATHSAYTDLNFTHTRVGSVLVTLLIITLAVRVFRATAELRLCRPALALLGMVAVQFTLGLFVIWHGKPATLTNLHVLNGALLLATAVLLALRLTRAVSAAVSAGVLSSGQPSTFQPKPFLAPGQIPL